LPTAADDKENKDHRKDRIVGLFGGRLADATSIGIVRSGIQWSLGWAESHSTSLCTQRNNGMSGASFLISYVMGSMIVCLVIWILLFLYNYAKQNYSVSEALEQLPAWHIQQLGLPGMLAGLFYSVGNFCSILAVT
jgi:hypothetical protein